MKSPLILAQGGELREGERLLRLPQVLQIIPVSRSEWYRRLAAGDAPAAVELGPRARAWRLSDINDYLIRIAARDRTQVGSAK
ncbi:helix-turn-helix transcriptional regulator [Pseudoxanthomonas wuyuanensis]|uniref:Transcriptional regulator, AlpA family n=1 Tax=Pseudoxanthomonas wuyuanensis TaxID=1073196 RepID=A0A286CXZ2_9GAMM|nr:AlpA family phage regulatory protein [Pseudoxanthomonas wuyuanensis]KAF1722655.1 AlpA family phage regulatory protein [Pseudoxanthomonas wuyuanensis]SOD51254.1 transcriptional regulator, AlpA family [Pseudoxanthomonas wuyuanensis]